MEVRQMQSADWKELREVRLRALADAPGAFASTLEREAAYPDDVWRQRAQGDPRPRTSSSVRTGPVSAWPRPSLSPPLGVCSSWGCGWTRITAAAGSPRR